ncbi:MAG: hypothetical protein ACTSRE_03900 [Promethearchaeota archaeon]
MDDSALNMKKSVERGEKISFSQIKDMLEESELVKKLTSPVKEPKSFHTLRGLEWRLNELSEIPYTHTLPQVQQWISLLVNETYTGKAFSLREGDEGVLACHNAMITTLLLKFEYEDAEKINTGIDWILQYQSVDRDMVCTWKGKDLYEKFGGCMKKVPCFYGVVKSMIALAEYKKRYKSSKEIIEKLTAGLEYILSHEVYKTKSTKKPIEPSIIQNFYPYSYKSNLIEILGLLKEHKKLEDPRCKDAIKKLKSTQRKDGLFQADVVYMKSAWIEFDPLKKPGAWITYEIEKIIK